MEVEIKYFLFYLENVAEKNTADAERACALIRYLRSPTFHFFNEKFAHDGEMTVEATSYSTVK